MADATVLASAAAPAAAPGAAPVVVAPAAAPEFKAADAVAFLTEHGTDAKALEGLAEADLKTRYESAKTVAEKAAAKARPSAPEKYEFKAPEGVTIDAEMSKEYEAFAKEAGLPQDKAQKGFELGGKIVQRMNAANDAAVKAVQTQWLEQAKVDKEFGGEKLQENLTFISKARDTFATPEMRKLLEDTKLGNHPEVLRLFYRVGKALQEDKVIGGRQGTPEAGEIAQRLYGATTPKAA